MDVNRLTRRERRGAALILWMLALGMAGAAAITAPADSLGAALHGPGSETPTVYRFSGSQTCSRSCCVLGPDTLELTFPEQTFSFAVTICDSLQAPTSEYAYSLAGVTRDWIYLGRRPFATVSNLPPGIHDLEVYVRRDGDTWTRVVGPVAVVVHQPPWKRAWMWWVIGLTAVVGVLAGYRYRLRRVEAQKRHLEEQVTRRTQELSARKEELERLNIIVKSINAESSLPDLLQAILNETRLIHPAQKASAIIRESGSGTFRFTAAVGWSMDDLEPIRLTAEQAEDRYSRSGREVAPDVFIVRPEFDLAPDPRFAHIPRSCAMLIMRVRLEQRVEGYLIFDNLRVSDAFDALNRHLLIHLKEHVTSAIKKARMLEELRTLNRRKNEFVGIAAHDLRSPLTAMIGYLALNIDRLESGRFDPDRGRRDLSMVLDSARRMSKLVNELLNIAAIESGKTRLDVVQVDLIELLESSTRLYENAASRKKIDLRFQADGPLPTLAVDRERINEVLDNLISNAIKYTYPGGWVKVWYQRDGEQVIVHVSDNGQGIPETEQGQVFDSFRKISSQPTGGESSCGLGLSIARKLVELHGGRIWLTSAPGEGATFSFSVPCPQGCGHSGTVRVPVAAPVGSGKSEGGSRK